MQPRDAFRVVYIRRDCRDRNGRGVAGQYRLRRADLSQPDKQRFFHLKTLRSGLYHQLRHRERADISDREQPGEDLSAGICREFTACDPGSQMAVAGSNLGDAGTHRAAANHGDSPYVQHLISP